ncbi:NifB/NifX family molybdenum-iron cluster-binding protein [Psychromonas antarctica]|jgi:predicted Fe-Mo cluster-binding NifX family protein|uniref:NifB/NifX family molybdenum-iron cluster-binding protein n=1 Tax=Psychromonas antarctica TaxID=67573 RepID=UPI001EE7C80D|nr:NifB/NifX family molybdenum-iron cluster-binding protein [Psychromonas antarctica]MCG6200837.1 NifB/NifX family molybdenum-iron cluster-binding protein [Psychromonas antarctica]
MKVALLTAQSRVSPVFETTSTWLIIDATPSECSIVNTFHFNTQNEIDMTNELLKENVEMIICGAIPYYLEKILINQGCEVFSFIAGDVDEVIEALHLNLLDKPKFSMPGCQKRRKRGKKRFCQRAVNQ